MTDLAHVRQSWPLPTHRRPIVVVGAGGIVHDAHLPAYLKAGLEVAGIFDLNQDKARKLAEQFHIPLVAKSLDALITAAPADAVWDLALPAAAHQAVLEALPDESLVLMQKPMGDDLAMAGQLLDACHRKRHTCAINHQLRFAPYCLAARDLIDRGLIGELHTLEVRLTVYTPWHLWDFLEKVPRMEIQYHSVHYIDMIRSFLGEPQGVDCMTVKHPEAQKLASVRTRITLNYGQDCYVGITANHCHKFGATHQESYILWEGTRGAVKAKFGLLLDYPKGKRDSLDVCLLNEDDAEPTWTNIALRGSWYPDAFIGPMANLQRFAAGEDESLWTSVDDVYRTMAVVEACYESNESGGTPIPGSTR